MNLPDKLVLASMVLLFVSFGMAYAEPTIDDDIGKKGNKDGQFKSPFDAVVDSKGNLYVSDAGNHRIQKFDSDGKFVLEFGEKGKKDGQFSSPKGMALDKSPQDLM